MPKIIRFLFVLPDLKKSPYSIGLIYNKNLAKRYQDGIDTNKIIVVSLDKKRVTKVVMLDNNAKLIQSLNN